MDRKEVEALLAETKDPMISTLCRTQLAVWDAPVGEAIAMGSPTLEWLDISGLCDDDLLDLDHSEVALIRLPVEVK